LAAWILGGEFRRRRRERFQAHLLEWEACWGEVQAARRGRALAESVREVALHHLRDRIRATVEVVRLAVVGGRSGGLASPPSPSPRCSPAASWSPAGSRPSRPRSPPPSPATGRVARAGAARPTPHASGSWVTYAGGARAAAHWAICQWCPHLPGPAGDRVVLLQADRSFPTAVGAHHPAGSGTWMSEVEGVVLFCADRPAPSLVVGRDRAKVLVAAARLGLR
jgi:hypothetical protein